MTIDFITEEKDYWVASNAINITLNALSEPNRIQCSVSSGAVVRCFYEHIDEADSLGYTVAHDYHQWPISSSPTYFNSNTEKYVYIAIPRSAEVGTQAVVVFPSEKLDIYGRKAVKSTDPETGEETIVYEQIGSTDYFYVWLQATISAPLLIDGVLQRKWTTQIATGKLDTPQGNAERETDSEWYLWSAIGGFVTFLREIRMSVDSWFANIRLGKDKRELTGVATADTPDEFVDSDTLVVTPSYLKKNTEDKFLRKDQDDATPYSLGVGEDLTVGGDVDITGQERVDLVQSHNYSGSGLADTGFLITNDNGSGDSLGVFDYLTVRKKMIINSLEIKETHFSAGDVAHTLASAEIARTDYFYVDENGNRELLGYSTILVPWSLRGGLLALAKGNLRGIFGHYKKVRLTLTQSQLERCNRIRCYFLAKDGDREVENWFRANDLVLCQTWNVLKTKRETFIPNLEEHDGNVYWWRKVHDVSWNTGVTRYVAKDAEGNPTGSPTTDPANAYVNEGGVKRLYDNGIYHTKGTEGYDDHQPVTIDGNTYHWFDVDYNYFSDESVAAAGSDIPAAGDKVIQFGNATDPDRMNIYMIEVNGAGNPDAPDWKMYRGVYTFNLNQCWWGGASCRKTKWSVSTGIEAYAPYFKWVTEYGIARQVFVRDEVYWNKIPFERDDDWSKAISSYPEYSDDIVDANGRFVSRADGSPKNFVRKCRYYEQVSHNGSAWLCSVVESFYWRSADGRKIPAKTDGAEYVRNYTYDEPSAESNNWTEQVEKGDPGAFKSTVFCRSNSTPAAPSNDKKDGCNTFDNPVPPVVSGQPTWTDGIPDGTAILWASTAWFYSDGTHQDWTTPRQQTDTETLDVEFSPNATQPSAPYGTAANKDTASTKAQRHSQGWYDPNDTLPSGVTWSDMKWRAERKIKNGVYYGSWAITRIKGENSVRIDLDNENDSMLYTSGGTLVSGNVLSTARLFDGATDVSTSATWTMTAVGCTMSSGNSRNIVVTGMTAATGYVNVQAVYTDKNGTVFTKTTRLTLKKLVDVDKYDLDITPNSIAYNATRDQPATSVLTIKVWKMTVDGNRVLSNPPSGYGVYVNNAKQTASSTGTYSYTTDNSAISSVQVKIAKDADLDAILDSETIPVNKAEDGAPGTSPYFADIDNEMDSVACDKNGKTLTDYDTTIGVSLWHGSHPLDITTLTTDSIQGFTITPDKTARTIRIQVPQGTSIAEVNKIGITIAGSGSGNLPLHFVLNGVRQGENGEPAVLYSLIPSVSSVVRKKDGTYSVDNVSCTRQKNVGGTITNNTTDGAITYKLDGGTEKAYTNNTDIAVTSFTKSIQFIFKVDGKVVDIETIPMVADGVDGVTPTVAIVDGYWFINDQPTGVKAEGTDGTGVEIKGTVASPSKMTIRDGKGYAIPMNSDGSDAPEVEVKHGDCYICNSDRHLYMFTSTPAVAWNDLGEFQGKPGEPGKSSYMHIAYAKKNPLNVTTSTVDTIGFTVNSDGSQYEWMGFCTDDKESDPGRNWGSLSPSQKVAAVNAYKWNYMKGKDGSGYEYIYLLTKEGFKPTIDESSGQGSQSDDEFYPSVGNYQDGKIYDNSRYWNDDPPADISETWPVLWWASRKKSDGVWQAFGSVDLHNRYAKDGTSPWIADLDNEMDSVACDNDGKPVVQQTVSTNVSLFYGSQKKAFITSVNGGDTGITISFSNKTAATAKDSDTITVTFATNAVISGKKEFEITLTAKDDASIQRVLTLTVNGLKGGATYNLVPSDSFVLLNKANQYVPSVLTCTYNKFDVAKGQFVTPAGGTVKYIKDGETDENAYKQLVPGTDFTNNVTFLLYVGATLVDRETIHIVKDGTDGLSVQSYIETQEAWSNQETTASADTMPSDCQEGDWKDSTPANTNSRTYLWRRSRKMTLKTDKSGYDAGQWSYTRLSGTNGTSIKTQGTVADTSKLLDRQVIPLVNGSDGQRTDVQDGWAYISEADRHLYQWSDELRSKSSTWVDWRSGWLDLGEFKGESGKTYYTHIAWAKGIILKKDGDGRAVTTDRTAGQRTMPNAVYPMTAEEQELFDFSIAPQEDLTWMGTLVDEDTTDAADYKYYTWKYVQGADGTSPWIADLDNEMDSVACDNDGKPVVQQTVSTNVSLFYGSQKKAFITSVNGGDTGITISFSNKTAATAKDSDTITVTFATNAVISGKKEFEITLTAKDDASIQRVLTLTVNGLKGGATYNLVPSDSFVLLNKANQYVPSVLTCTYNKFDVAKGQFVTPAGGTVKYIKDGETDENAYKQLVPGTDFTNNVTFLLYVGATLVDRETIHIVKDGTDGLSVQSYIETQEAWSNQETTASADTMPSDCQEGDWKDSTPANTNSRTYLWRRSRKMTLKTDKSGYDAGQWSYTRLSGTNGTSIKTQGTVADTSKLLDRQVIPLVNGSDGQRTDVQDGWAYISEADRHLYQWSDELRSKSSTWVDWRSGWLDLGEFKGESGKTYYTHIAWAKGIILKKDGDGRAVTTDRTAGQRTMPNAVYPMTAEEQELFDFSIAPQEDLTWMGTLVDEDTTDAADYKYYTWKYVQGADGNGVEYVYIRTATNVAPTITNSSDTYAGKTYLDDDYLPLSSAGRCTDDPQGTSHDLPYEWVCKRTKGAAAADGTRKWEKYSGAMALWANYSEDGQSTFKSHVFKRQAEQPDAPTGGSYSKPVPSGWSDGVPDGTLPVWMSTRVFTSDGKTPQQSAWTTPRQMTDTANFDVEFSSVATPNPPSGHPNTNTQWSNTSDSTTIWMATSECHNGVWSDWQVVKIKGEKGDDGQKGDDGEKGDKGDDAYSVIVNPAYCIFSEEWTEGSSALTVDLRQTISIQVKQNNTFKPFKLTYGRHRYCTVDASASTAANTEVSSATLKFGSIATYQSSGQTLYRDQGYLVVNIATVDGNFSQTGIRIPFYLNTKGRFERKIHGDYETAMTQMSEWYPQSAGEPVKHSWLYNELNSAKERLTELIESIGCNLLPSAGWQTKYHDLLDAEHARENENLYIGDANIPNVNKEIFSPRMLLAAGMTYCISFYSNHADPNRSIYYRNFEEASEPDNYVSGWTSVACTTISGESITLNGTTYTRRKGTFKVAQGATALYYVLGFYPGDSVPSMTVLRPQLEVNDDTLSPRQWAQPLSGSQSLIRQTARQIDLVVTELETNLEKAGVHIDGDNSLVKIVGQKFEVWNAGATIKTFSVDSAGNIVGNNNATFKGNIEANGGTFAGTIKANAYITEYYDTASDSDPLIIGKDELEGRWNIKATGRTLLLPTNVNLIGQKVTIYNADASIGNSPNWTTLVTGDDIDTSGSIDGKTYFRGVFKSKTGSSLQPVLVNDYETVSEIHFGNGIAELMAVPYPGDSTRCAWCVLNIGCNLVQLVH